MARPRSSRALSVPADTASSAAASSRSTLEVVKHERHAIPLRHRRQPRGRRAGLPPRQVVPDSPPDGRRELVLRPPGRRHTHLAGRREATPCTNWPANPCESVGPARENEKVALKASSTSASLGSRTRHTPRPSGRGGGEVRGKRFRRGLRELLKSSASEVPMPGGRGRRGGDGVEQSRVDATASLFHERGWKTLRSIVPGKGKETDRPRSSSWCRWLPCTERRAGEPPAPRSSRARTAPRTTTSACFAAALPGRAPG
jgi:hypothetical protein